MTFDDFCDANDVTDTERVDLALPLGLLRMRQTVLAPLTPGTNQRKRKRRR